MIAAKSALTSMCVANVKPWILAFTTLLYFDRMCLFQAPDRMYAISVMCWILLINVKQKSSLMIIIFIYN